MPQNDLRELGKESASAKLQATAMSPWSMPAKVVATTSPTKAAVDLAEGAVGDALVKEFADALWCDADVGLVSRRAGLKA